MATSALNLISRLSPLCEQSTENDRKQRAHFHQIVRTIIPQLLRCTERKGGMRDLGYLAIDFSCRVQVRSGMGATPEQCVAASTFTGTPSAIVWPSPSQTPVPSCTYPSDRPDATMKPVDAPSAWSSPSHLDEKNLMGGILRREPRHMPT